MIYFNFPVDSALRSAMYRWLGENVPDAKYIPMEDRMIIIGVRLNERDATAFRLKFGI